MEVESGDKNPAAWWRYNLSEFTEFTDSEFWQCCHRDLLSLRKNFSTGPISLLIVNLPRSDIHEIAHTANGLDLDKAYLRSVLRKTGRVWVFRSQGEDCTRLHLRWLSQVEWWWVAEIGMLARLTWRLGIACRWGSISSHKERAYT